MFLDCLDCCATLSKSVPRLSIRLFFRVATLSNSVPRLSISVATLSNSVPRLFVSYTVYCLFVLVFIDCLNIATLLV